MIIWIDAQISPRIAEWINQQFDEIEATHVRDLGLRDASDLEIFKAASKVDAIVMSKDIDFTFLINNKGIPPKLIWITCGNTSNKKLTKILENTLDEALNILSKGENVVEIKDL